MSDAFNKAVGITPAPPTAPAPMNIPGLNYMPGSTLPGYGQAPGAYNPLDPNTGKLSDQYQAGNGNVLPGIEARFGNLNLNPAAPALSALSDFGMGTGDSPWAQAQLEMERQGEGVAQGNVGRQVGAATTAASDFAGSHGGLSTGAAENLARNKANNLVLGKQAVAGKGIEERGKIRSADASNRLGVLSNLPGQQVQGVQPGLQGLNLWNQAAEYQNSADAGTSQFNAKNTLGAVGGLNQFNQTNYLEQIKAQAGTAAAEAAGNRGKK